MARRSSIDEQTAQRLRQALRQHDGNVTTAAAACGVSVDAARRWLKKQPQGADPTVQDQVEQLLQDVQWLERRTRRLLHLVKERE